MVAVDKLTPAYSFRKLIIHSFDVEQNSMCVHCFEQKDHVERSVRDEIWNGALRFEHGLPFLELATT